MREPARLPCVGLKPPPRSSGSVGLPTSLLAQPSGPLLLAALTANPAKLLGQPAGRLAKGAPADLVLIDPDLPYVIDKRRLKSRSKNSPFDEARLQGGAVLTMVGGKIVHAANDLAAAA